MCNDFVAVLRKGLVSGDPEGSPKKGWNCSSSKRLTFSVDVMSNKCHIFRIRI